MVGIGLDGVMVDALVILLCAGINRARGDDRWMPSWLPGRALFWVAPAIGLSAWTVQPWPIALTFATGYAFWGVFSWGHILAALGGIKPARSPSTLEAFLMLLPGTIAPTCARMLFVLPGVAVVAWLLGNPLFLIAGPAFVVAATAAYALLFRPIGALDWPRAEIVTGGLWGLLILSPKVIT